MKTRGCAATVKARKLYLLQMKSTRIAYVYVSLIAVLIALAFIFYQIANPPANPTPMAPTPSTSSQTNYFSYQGKSGVDALTLLKQSATIEQNSSGLVTSINGRKANDSSHEFWAFYVNGQEAQVGPSSYTTKDSDKIEWKIEKY